MMSNKALSKIGVVIQCIVIICLCLLSVNSVSAVELTCQANTEHFDEISNAIKHAQPKLAVDGWDYTTQEVFDAINYVLYTCPEYYYCLSKTCYSVNGTPSYVDFTYDNQYSSKNKAISDAAEKLVASFDSTNMQDWEIALAVHDYLISHIYYPIDWYNAGTLSEHPSVYNIYGALVENVAVCSGYTDAYIYILRNYFGIECGYAKSETESHAWAVVKINGRWYHIDVSADDPYWDTLGRVGHSHLFLSENAISSLSYRYTSFKVFTPPGCTYSEAWDRSFEQAFWTLSESCCFYYSNRWFFIDCEKKQLKCYDTETGQIAKILDLPNNKWVVLGKSGWTWSSSYSKLLLSGHTLYFSTTDDIRSYDIDKNKESIIYSIHSSCGQIYGFGETPNGVGYVIRTTPCAEAYDQVIPISEHILHLYHDSAIIVPASYSASGIVLRICEECGDEMIAAVGPVVRPNDVLAGSWYDQSVEWALSHGIASGVGKNSFSPDSVCTRAQFITLLWRTYGCPTPCIETPFSDVADNLYYSLAVRWAYEQGIVSGTSDGKFNPDAGCSRAAAVMMIWRAAGATNNECKNTAELFEDVAPNAWYAPGIAWAISYDIASGIDGTHFSPDAICTRSQVVTLLFRASEAGLITQDLSTQR